MQKWIDLIKEFGQEIDEAEFLKCFPELKEEEMVKEYEFTPTWKGCLVAGQTDADQHPFAYEYADEIKAGIYKIHRYSRFDRFRFLMYRLIGVGGGMPVPDEVLVIVREDMKNYVDSRMKIWNTVRKILKARGMRKYYNHIPEIIGKVKGWYPEGVAKLDVPVLLLEFQRMSAKFDEGLRKKWGVKYFPNLRFVALKLIEKHGVTYPYHTPLVRTMSKKVYLNKMYEDF